MRIIGNKLLEVIKLKQALVLIVFASHLFPQFNINQITHPLGEQSSDFKDKDKSYLVLNSASHFDIPIMLNQFDNSTAYFKKAIIINPNHIISLFNLASSLDKQNKLDEAMKNSERNIHKE